MYMYIVRFPHLTNSGGGGEKGGVLVDTARARGLESVLDVGTKAPAATATPAQQSGAASEEAGHLASEHTVRVLVLAANKTW